MTAAKPATDPLICLGVIVAAHGVRGEVKIKVFGGAAQNWLGYGPLTDADGNRPIKLRRLREARGGAVAEIEGVTTREAAEALRGTELYVRRSALPAPAADEFYQADLIGLVAASTSGEILGTVIAVHNFGAGDILEIEGENGGEPSLMAPFRQDVVPEVDLAKRRVVIDLAKAGLDKPADAAPPAPENAAPKNPRAGNFRPAASSLPRRQKAARP